MFKFFPKYLDSVLILCAIALVLILRSDYLAEHKKEPLHEIYSPSYKNDPKKMIQKVDDEKIVFELAPSVEIVVDGITYRTNSEGLRDRTYSIEKPKGTKRIIVLGGSFTFGQGVELHETFVKQLERKLFAKEKYNWEVLNFGLQGQRARQAIASFEAKGLQYSPDIVIVMYYLNDPEIFDLDKKLPWKNHYQLLQDIQDYYKAPIRLDASSKAKTEKFLEEQDIREHLELLNKDKKNNIIFYNPEHMLHRIPFFWGKVQSSFQKLAELSEENQFKVVLGIIPLMTVPWDDYHLKDVHLMVKMESQANGFITFDLFDTLSKYPGEQLRVSKLDWHTNKFANGIIADEIHMVLKENSLIP